MGNEKTKSIEMKNKKGLTNRWSKHFAPLRCAKCSSTWALGCEYAAQGILWYHNLLHLGG